ncbi:hypothetical protein JCM33374_g5064 [Metschnikowia sp. JCM 33374]|nr:hypothetical protein JCM33374_g5064 [Metschnikowia sp. JCM 33374]
MSVSVTFPEAAPHTLVYTRLRENVPVGPPAEKSLPLGFSLRVPYFTYNNSQYVLVRDLAGAWNFPSSYQVITRLTRKSGVPKSELLRTSDEALNELLVENGLLLPAEQNTSLFYIELAKLYSILLEDSSILVSADDAMSVEAASAPAKPLSDEESITISQVFPNYGAVEESLPLNHATFLSLTPLTKLHVYKHEGNYRKVYGTSLSAHERELLTISSNYTSYDVSTSPPSSSEDSERSKKSKKPLGRQKKFVGNVDPNQLDVTENVLPGCGLIPEFNVNSICKVPNYFVTNKEMGAQQNALHNPAKSHLDGLRTKGKKPSDMPKQLYQLLSNTDQEAYHFKYYYFKSYRGPGSGNYKDAALVNKINKIKRFTPATAPTSNSNTHIAASKVTKPPHKRGDIAIKGLVHEYFSHENVEIVIERQRRFVEDFENLEMLHNNTLFNLLVNAYREVASDTWDAFYKFKMIDFEKMYSKTRNQNLQVKKAELLARQAEKQSLTGAPVPRSDELTEVLKADLSTRFSLPSDYPEIMEKLPCELRGDDGDEAHSLSEPVRYIARYPDKNSPGMLNQIEVVKLPNANSLAWDNIKKYRRN